MSKFYDGSELLSRSNYNIFFSLGGRNIGKSTFWQRYIIRHWLKKHEKFGIIVKYATSLDTFAKNYFSQTWMDQWYPDYEIRYKKEQYWIKLKDLEDEEKNWEQCGYAIALNKNADIKSTTIYHDIQNLLFEEFMPLEDRYIGSAKDPEKEPKLLTSVYQTIARGTKGEHTRPVKLILISNNYTMNNPYFTYFHILPMITANPNSIYQQFYTYDDETLHYALEFSQMEPEMTGIEGDDSAAGVRFCDFRNDLNIIKDQPPKKIGFQVMFDENYVINIAQYNNTLCCWKDKDNKIYPDVCSYSCGKFKRYDIMSVEALKREEIYKTLIYLFNCNLLYYDKLETFIHLTNILAY